MTNISILSDRNLASQETTSGLSKMKQLYLQASKNIANGINHLVRVIDLEKISAWTNRLTALVYKPATYALLIWSVIATSADDVQGQHETLMVEWSATLSSLQLDTPDDKWTFGYGAWVWLRYQWDDTHVWFTWWVWFEKFSETQAEDFYVKATTLKAELWTYLSTRTGLDDWFAWFIEWGFIGEMTDGTSNYRDREWEEDYTNLDVAAKLSLWCLRIFDTDSSFWCSLGLQRNLFTDEKDNRKNVWLNKSNDLAATFKVFFWHRF